MYKPRRILTPNEHKAKLDQYRESNTIPKIKKLLAMGYWQSNHEPSLPHPAYFVDEAWEATEKALVISHLQQSQRIASWCGRSWCRFDCGETKMGACCLTDGLYIYPEGLVHYLTNHHIKLPIEFIEHVKSYQPRKIDFHYMEYDIDFTWWQNQKTN